MVFDPPGRAQFGVVLDGRSFPDEATDASVGVGGWPRDDRAVNSTVEAREVVKRDLVCPGQSPNSESSAGRRKVPERPPVFSQSARSVMVMARSMDLHMS
jgi:hypothetical protein